VFVWVYVVYGCVYEYVCVNVCVFVNVYVYVYVRVCVHVLSCLTILQAFSGHLLVSLEDCSPIRVVCWMIIPDLHSHTKVWRILSWI